MTRFDMNNGNYCFHLNPGNNPCTISDGCVGIIKVHISQWFPEWYSKTKREPFKCNGDILIDLEKKFDSFYNKSIDNKKQVLLGECRDERYYQASCE